MDKRIVIYAAQKGDLEAFNQLVLGYQDLVYNHACWLTGDSDIARDIAQDSFLKAFHHLSSFRGESLRRWLLRIVTNTGYDELRRGKRHRSQPWEQTGPDGEVIGSPAWLIDPSVSIERAVEQGELSDMLRQHLEALPEKYRSVAVLIDVLELDYREAAEALGVTIGTVKYRLGRAHSQIACQAARDTRGVAVQTGASTARSSKDLTEIVVEEKENEQPTHEEPPSMLYDHYVDSRDTAVSSRASHGPGNQRRVEKKCARCAIASTRPKRSRRARSLFG